MKLAYDTETDGLPQKSLPLNHPSQPNLVQLACILSEDNDTERASFCCVIKPEGWTIPANLEKLHGISTELALRVGVPLAVAMGVFSNFRALADEKIGHNLEFDEQIMAIQFAKLGRQPKNPGPTKISCTMKMATPLVKIPPTPKMVAAGFGHKFKNANLSESYEFFFGEKLIGAHDALVDVRASIRIYWHLQAKELSPGLA